MANERTKFVDIVQSFQKEFPRSEKYPQNTLFRSYAEINNSKIINYLCCSERNLVIAQRASEEGLSPTGLLLGIKRFTHPIKVGTAIEINLDGTNYTFSSINSGDSLESETLELNRKFYQIERATILPDEKKSWFEHFGIKNQIELEKIFLGFNSSLALALERKPRSKSNYQRHMNKVEKNKSRENYL